MVTFTRAVPILVYEPEALTTSSPGMAGTVKLPDPELVFVGCEEVGGELCGCSVAVAVTEGLTAAECVCVREADGVGDDPDVPVNADVGAAPGVVAAAAGGAVD
jgi:hypothetical protein